MKRMTVGLVKGHWSSRVQGLKSSRVKSGWDIPDIEKLGRTWVEELLAYVGAELKKPQEEISDELVFLINSRIKPPQPVTKEDIFVRTMFLVSDQVNSYGGRFPLEELHQLTTLVIDSPVMVGHTKEKLPIARNFKAEVVQRNEQNWVKVWFYWLRSSRDALSLKENIDHGIYKECSLGFVFEFPECSICGQDMRKCAHVPFKVYPTQDGEKEAYFNYRNIVRVLETSLVYRGAVPNTSMSDELRLYHKSETSGKETTEATASDSGPEITPFDFVPPGGVNKLHSAANVIFRLEDLRCLAGSFVIEPRYDGVRLQVHKQGDIVKILSRDGREIQHAFPHLVEELLQSPQESLILDGECVKYKGHSRLPHTDAALYVQLASNLSSVAADDSHFRFKALDLLYLNGEDRTALTLEVRKRLLDEFFQDTAHLQKAKYEKATGEDLSSKAKAIATSEGCTIRRSDAAYFQNSSWYEWRGHPDLDVLVLDSEKNKGGSYNYVCAVGTKGNPVPIGATYSTFLEAKPGEIIRVRVESVAEVDGRFVWRSPKVLDKRSEAREPDSTAVLRRMVDEDQSAVRGRQSAATTHNAAEDRLSTADRFVLQVHWWGDSRHHDLRFQKGDSTFGLTISQLDLGGLSRGRRFLCEWKDHHHVKRMDFEGEIPPQENGAEGNSSKRHVAHMKTLDRGKYELVQKEADLARVQIEGEILKGVYLVRKVRLKGKERWLFWKSKE